jgi:hypothetical protein
MSFNLRDYDLDRVNTPADWLARFVRDEVRPLLVQHRQTVLEAWSRWLTAHEERKKALDAWEARQQEFLRELAALPEDHQHGPEPPAEGFVLLQGRALLGEGRHRLVRGWGPRELSEYNGPPVELPLPPSIDRDISIDESWAALLAVHDAARDARERLVPSDSILLVELRRRARELTEAQLPDLRAMLRTASASMTPDTGRQRTLKKSTPLRNANRDAWVARQRAKKQPPSWEEIYDEGVRLAAKRGWDMPGSAKALAEAHRRYLQRQRAAKEG